MRPYIRLLALAVLISTALFWFTQGAHTGWTQRYVTRVEVDAVTGIEYPVKEERFVPGVDFLGLSGLAALIVFSASFMFRRAKKPAGDISLKAEPARSEATVDPDATTQFETEETHDNPTEDPENKRLT